jgi:hypothetical protein
MSSKSLLLLRGISYAVVGVGKLLKLVHFLFLIRARCEQAEPVPQSPQLHPKRRWLLFVPQN